jgi:hypothetical protein
MYQNQYLLSTPLIVQICRKTLLKKVGLFWEFTGYQKALSCIPKVGHHPGLENCF